MSSVADHGDSDAAVVTLTRQQMRAALNRDAIWAILWNRLEPGWPAEGWATVRDVYDDWRDGRDECGIVFVPDYIGNVAYFRHVMRWLVKDGRAEVSRAPGRHPLYRAVVPEDKEPLVWEGDDS